MARAEEDLEDSNSRCRTDARVPTCGRKTASPAAKRERSTHIRGCVCLSCGMTTPGDFAMALQHFKVLTFDVVGTLIDFERGMLDYLRAVVPETAVSDDDFLAAYRKARRSTDCIAYPDDLERCWHAVAPALGLPD